MQKQVWVQHVAYHAQRVQQAQKQAQENDPHVLNAKARLEQIEMEVQGLAKQKDIELNHLQQRKTIDLQAHGMKKGMDLALDKQKMMSSMAAQAAQAAAPALNGVSQ